MQTGSWIARLPRLSEQSCEVTVKLHPVQVHHAYSSKTVVSSVITERAYEVYKELYGGGQSLDRLNERAGFSVGELITLLYARTFPKSEWRTRDKEASTGMTLS